MKPAANTPLSLTRLFLFVCACLGAQLFAARAASVTTDKADYPPGATAYITASGFQAGETVMFQVLHADGTPSTGADHDPWYVTDGGVGDLDGVVDGNIQTTWHVCEDDCVGSTLELTATGQTSGLTTKTQFKDLDQQLYEESARTNKRDAFAWGSTVYWRGTGIDSKSCWFVQFKDPNGNVVQTFDLSFTTAANRDADFTIPSCGPSGVWSAELYKPTASGLPCSSAGPFTLQSTVFFDVARAVFVGAGSPVKGAPDAVGGDNFVDEKNPTSVTSAGTGTELNVQSKATENLRTFLRFGISGIPSTANVTAATLRMHMFEVPSTSVSRTYHIRSASATWAEGTITWNTKPSVSSTISATATTPTANNTQMYWSGSQLATDVDNFVATPTSNNGWEIRDSVEGGPGTTIGKFESTENDGKTSSVGPFNKTLWPVLLVDYNDLTITCPANATVQCASQVPAPNTASVTTSGGCTGSATVTFEGDVISNQICPNEYTITRTYKATDPGGNSKTCTQTITVNDTTAPTATQGSIAACYQTVAAANAAALAATTGLTDNCDPSPTKAVQTSATVACSTAVVIRVSDSCGNFTDYTYATRVDNTAPTVTPGTIAACYPTVVAAEAAAIAATSATDNCPGTVTKTASTVGTCSATVTVTATDACGNSASTSYSTRIDNTPPTVTAGSIASCYPTAAAAEAAAIAATTTTDNCPGTVTKTASTVGTCSATVTVTATDQCGNSASTSYSTRIDNTPPTLTAGSIASCYSTEAAAEAAAIAATTATDNCPGTVTKTATTVGTCSATVTVKI